MFFKKYYLFRSSKLYSVELYSLNSEEIWDESTLNAWRVPTAELQTLLLEGGLSHSETCQPCQNTGSGEGVRMAGLWEQVNTFGIEGVLG